MTHLLSLYDDSKNHIFDFLEFYELHNIKSVCKYIVSIKEFQKSLHAFMNQYNIVNTDTQDRCIQLFYLKQPYVWDYINICSDHSVYCRQRYKFYYDGYFRIKSKTIIYNKCKKKIICRPHINDV